MDTKNKYCISLMLDTEIVHHWCQIQITFVMNNTRHKYSAQIWIPGNSYQYLFRRDFNLPFFRFPHRLIVHIHYPWGHDPPRCPYSSLISWTHPNLLLVWCVWHELSISGSNTCRTTEKAGLLFCLKSIAECILYMFRPTISLT